MNIVIRKYHRLLRSLGLFISVIETEQGAKHLNRWSHAGEGLKRDLETLRQLAVVLSLVPSDESGAADYRVSQRYSKNDENMGALLRGTLQRLTQLARSQDGWSIHHFDSGSAERMINARRTVVVAAWHLLQSIQHLPARTAR